MPKQLQKSLSDYLSKIKHKSTPQPPNLSSNDKALSSSTSWLLRGCRHPKTPSFSAVDRKEKHHAQAKDNDAATLADIDQFLFENFKSFYSKDDNENEANNTSTPNNNNAAKKGKKQDTAPTNEDNTGGSFFELSPRHVVPPSNLSGSHRFFVPRRSTSSLIEEARISMSVTDDTGSTSATTTNTTSNDSSAISTDDNSKEQTLNADDFITVVTYSPSPYDDFRQSMQEMMEARLNDQGKINWEFMEELLFCYLNLNDKKSYKYILSAFVDLIVVLRENSGRVPVNSRNVLPLNQGNT